jgi:hypothetical protein
MIKQHDTLIQWWTSISMICVRSILQDFYYLVMRYLGLFSTDLELSTILGDSNWHIGARQPQYMPLAQNFGSHRSDSRTCLKKDMTPEGHAV